MHALPRPKIGLPSSDIHSFSYTERLRHSGKTIFETFFKKAKIGLPNLEIHESSYSEQIIHSKRYNIYIYIYILNLKKMFSHFFTRRNLNLAYQIWTRQFFCFKRLSHSKRHPKEHCCMALENSH